MKFPCRAIQILKQPTLDDDCFKKLDMGKSCVRFNKLDDLPIELIGEVISKFSVEECIKLSKRLEIKKQP